VKDIEVYAAHTRSEFLLKVVELENRKSKFLLGPAKNSNNKQLVVAVYCNKYLNLIN
jgi:hypothetical protein